MSQHLPVYVVDLPVVPFGEHRLAQTNHDTRPTDESDDQQRWLNKNLVKVLVVTIFAVAVAAVVCTAIAILELRPDAILEMMGVFYLEHLKRIGFDEILRDLSGTLFSFLNNLDSLIATEAFGQHSWKTPSFRCTQDSTNDFITLHYYSYYRDLHPLLIGLLRCIALHYFRQEVHIDVVSRSDEVVGPLAENGYRQHVVLTLRQRQHGRHYDVIEAPPTYVAQTRKHGEKQILQEDIKSVEAKRLSYGGVSKGNHQLEPIRRNTNHHVTLSTELDGVSRSPIYFHPREQLLSAKSISSILPYHIVFDKDLKVRQAGDLIQQRIPEIIKNKTCTLPDYFFLLYPYDTDFTYENLLGFIMSPFVLRIINKDKGQERPVNEELVLKGQMILLESNQLIVYMCSPHVRSLNELESSGLFMSDIPMHDVTRDLILMDSERRFISDSDTRMTGVNPNRDVKALTGDSTSSSPMASGRPAKELGRDIDKTLWYSLLPGPVADRMIAGSHDVEPAVFPNVTVLFADIVDLRTMIKICTPKQLIVMLNELEEKFSHLCKEHGVFRVETVGDAYLIMSGGPDQVEAHAQKIANTALGIILAVRNVRSPINGDKSLEVRLGIASGAVTCGVVGRGLPRYRVMGETVTMASRMESHGVAGKIQLPEETYTILKTKGYSFSKRGMIRIRGKGPVSTFFLTSSEKVHSSKPDTVQSATSLRQSSPADNGIELRQPSSTNLRSSSGKSTPNNKIHPDVFNKN